MTFLSACSKNILFDEQDSKSLNYKFKIQDLDNIDKTLQKQKYSYSTNRENKYIAIITYKSKDASMNQYIIDNNGTKELTIPEDTEFIISLDRNSTITYTWNIKNNIDNGIIKLLQQSFIDIPTGTKKPKPGEDYDRQNLYFKSLKSGNEKLVLRYEHNTDPKNEYFEITLNIKIQ